MTTEFDSWGWAPRSPKPSPGGGGVFPLPVPVSLQLDIWRHVSRGRRRAGLRDVQTTIKSLNWMHGAEGRPGRVGCTTATLRKIEAFQLDVTLRAEWHVMQWGVPPAALTTEAAETKLLRGKGSYESTSAHAAPAPFSYALLSLPPDVTYGPELARLADATAMKLLKGYQDHMLRPLAEVAELDAMLG